MCETYKRKTRTGPKGSRSHHWETWGKLYTFNEHVASHSQEREERRRGAQRERESLKKENAHYNERKISIGLACSSCCVVLAH